MTTPASPSSRPSRGWYALAAVLAALAVVIGAALAAWIIRALVGYEIVEFPEGEPVTIVLKDRGEAIWVTPENVGATCKATGDSDYSFSSGSADRMTFIRGGQTWVRVGILKGPPGAEYTVVCEDLGTTQQFGHAPNPQIGRYVVVGVSGGLVAGLSAMAAFLIVLVVAIKRNSKPRVA